MNVFLGGTCNNSRWREWLMPQLTVDYFNPVVTQWHEDCLARELEAKQAADFWLFVLTPKIEGYYSLAEVVDTSYKHTDRTIFCILDEDEGLRFNKQQLTVLQTIGETIEANGSLWFHSLEQIRDFFNADVSPQLLPFKQDTFDVFISYGRRHSKNFAVQLREALIRKGYSVWLDKENIALAVDFQQQIDEGIRHAANFCFIISPHAVHSEYCRKELNKAKEFNKRIIPIHHVDMGDSFDDIPADIMRLNWLLFDQTELFDPMLNQFVNMLEQDKTLVNPHCQLLFQADQWQNAGKNSELLLYGEEMAAATSWLQNISQRRDVEIVPLAEHTQFINASQYFSVDTQAQVCIVYASNFKQRQQELEYQLICCGFIVCSNVIDTGPNVTLEKQTETMLKKSVNIVLMLPEQTVGNIWQQIQAFIEQQQKRYFTLISTNSNATGNGSDFNTVIKLATNDETSALVDALIEHLTIDHDYLCLRNDLYCRAIQWFEFQTDAALLTLQESGEYSDFLTLSANKGVLGAPAKLTEFISISGEHRQETGNHNNIDIYICFSQEDNNFVRRLSRRLRELNKTSYGYYVATTDSDEVSEAVKNEIANAKFVFFIVPRQACKVVSSWLAAAENLGKHIIPLRLERFSNLNYAAEYQKYHAQTIVVDELLEFSMAEIVNALNTNDEHLESHRYWLQKKQLWQQNNSNSEFLLGSKESLFASKWLETAISHDHEPAPTGTQVEFINASQQYVSATLAKGKRNQQRLKTFSILSSFLCGLSLILLFNLYTQSNRLAQETKIAKHERANALKQEHLAQIERDNAVKQGELAQKERDNAMAQEYIAQKERDNAKQQEKRAIKNKEQADQSALIAKVEQEKAQRLQSIAEAEALVYQAKMHQEPRQQLTMALNAYHVLKQNGGNTNNNILFNLLYQQQKNGLAVLKGHQSSVKYLAFEKNKQQLISIDVNNTLYLWQVSTARNIKPIYQNKLSFVVKQIALNLHDRHNIKLLLLSQSGQLFHWSLEPKSEITQFENLNFKVDRISLLNNDNLWLQGEKHLYQYDVIEQNWQKQAIEVNKSTLVFLNKDANEVVTQHQGIVKLWRRDSLFDPFKSYWSVPQKSLISQVIFVQKHHVIIAGDEQGWFYQYPITAKDENKADIFRAHDHQLVASIFSSQSNSIISASLNGTIKLWQPGKALSKHSPIQFTHSQWIHSLTLAAIGEYTFIFAGTESGDIKLYPGQIDSLIDHGIEFLAANNLKEAL
ncbi:TIR domain-containing protein [Colwellia psychrerythraea]|uniref:TIR protein n=1 Tax=Colwellia psychrerythraea TaxID=28229 RepID=A0A099KEA9_COLPS|nr:TIR domain-containing protein [Colwellia psychrerythraea]KGJ87953.1 TIR protein [Colwellia psychrerythraea]